MKNIVQLDDNDSIALSDKQRKQNKLAKLSRRRLSIDESLAEGLVFKIAESHDELEQAYRLVHDVYQEEGYTDIHPSGMRINAYNAHPETVVFIAVKATEVIMTLTLVSDSPFGLPMDDLYLDELVPFRKTNRKMGQLCALASQSAYRSTNQTLPLLLMKVMRQYAHEHLRLDDLLITVNPKHGLFYENLLLFEKMGELKSCQDVKGHPAFAYLLNLNLLAKNYKQVYRGQPPEKNLHHFFCQKNSPHIKLPENKRPIYIWSNDKLKHFFAKKTAIFEQINDEYLSYILEQHALYENNTYAIEEVTL